MTGCDTGRTIRSRKSCYAPGMDTDTFTIIGTVLAVGLALATLIMRSTARQDADRRAVLARFDTAMDTFRTEMQRLAERQPHVEGRFDGRGSATG